MLQAQCMSESPDYIIVIHLATMVKNAISVVGVVKVSLLLRE
jgi:hypothetical protein